MRDWIAAQLAAGLPGFAGSKLSGTVAAKQEVINELIAKWLAANSAPSAAPSAAPLVDPRMVRAAIKRASVRAENGKLLIDFEISL
jgi:hypothetical protein